MRGGARRAVVAVALVAAAISASRLSAQAEARRLPPSRLAVFNDGAWQEWWRSSEAPAAWRAPDERVAGAVGWRPVAPGLDWGELRLSGSGEAWRLKVVVARIDPARIRLSLDTAFTAGRARANWSIDRAGEDVLLAVNTGQFPRAMPWGWVVIDGREFLPPGSGPLSMAMAVDATGRVRWIAGDSLPGADRRDVRTAFQSYPTLLVGGEVPLALRGGGLGVDVEHRDARLAIGQDRAGSLVVALTRFDAAGDALDFVPFGLTTPEMAAVMGALGAVNAVMLDGGISSQMLVRDPSGVRRWEGLRKVPLGLVGRRR